MEKLSFHLILPTGKISFSIFFNPLINFQEINIFWKIFSFLQLNTTLVQINWRIYFFFISGKTLHQFLEFYPQGKNIFSIFLLSQFAFFNFPGNKTFTGKWKTKEKWLKLITVLLARPAKPARPSYSPRALPHPGRNLGLGQQSRASALARLGRGQPDHLQPFDLIDGSPACFGRSKAAELT